MWEKVHQSGGGKMTNNKANSDEKTTSEVKNKQTDTPTIADELAQVLEEVTQDETPATPPKGEPVTLLNETDLMVGEREYKLVANHREGFNAEKLGERFSDVLARYDYIVGDWGYEQLRLKGFFEADDRKALPEQRIDTLEDYLYEFCNFGCAYFVIKRIGGKREKTSNRRRRKKGSREESHQENAAGSPRSNEGNTSGTSKKSGATRNNRGNQRGNQKRTGNDNRSDSRSNNRGNSQNKTSDSRNKRQSPATGQAFIEERREKLNQKRRPVIKNRQEKPATPTKPSQPAHKSGKKGGYTIRKRED